VTETIRVLLIEDDEEDYILTRELLADSTDTRFDVKWVSTYSSAVDALRGGDSDVFLIDYRLGQHDGLELIKQFAASPFPMIMLTGEDDRTIDLEAMRFGAMDYLVKGQINTALLERSIRYSIARKHTEEALRRKDEFLAMLAHELRNPLAPIRTALQILELPQLEEAHGRRARAVLKRQVDQMVRLVDDLLDAARIMQGRIELHKEPQDLLKIVELAIETAGPVIDAQGHRVVLNSPPRSFPIEADAIRFSQAIANLLTNAAKYSEKSSEIFVSVAAEGDDALLLVRDQGVGIDPDLLPRVFDLFVQGDRALARSQGGLGIGLTIVKRLVELHGGTVTAYSDGRGKGSEFVVRIPMTISLARGEDAPAPPVPAGTRNVLIVDDNVDAAECIGVMLKSSGHQVEVAYDGFGAVEAARRHKPDIILLDIGLPGRDGYEVARILRRDSDFKNTKIIAVSGYGKEEDRIRCKQAGIDHHLTKPVERDDLEQVLRALK
jgi:two-component system CheB/CheR fusion protein